MWLLAVARKRRRSCLRWRARPSSCGWASHLITKGASLGPGQATSKIDRTKLAQLIEAQPDLLQREMVQIMGVSPNGISRALMAMEVTRTSKPSARQPPLSARNTCCATGERTSRGAHWCTWMKPALCPQQPSLAWLGTQGAEGPWPAKQPAKTPHQPHWRLSRSPADCAHAAARVAIIWVRQKNVKDFSVAVIASLAMLSLVRLLPDETFWCEYAHQQIGTVLCSSCFTVINPDSACHTARREKR